MPRRQRYSQVHSVGVNADTMSNHIFQSPGDRGRHHTIYGFARMTFRMYPPHTRFKVCFTVDCVTIFVVTFL